jgi:hypothetical protein
MIPCSQESAEALAAAKQALEDYDGKFWFGNLSKVEAEFCELDLLVDSERFMAVDFALQEITPEARCGPSAPDDFSTHPPSRNLPMYAFCWNSSDLKRRMYLKFALSFDCKKARLVVYSFHEARF